MMIDGTADAISGGQRVRPNKFRIWHPQYLLGAILILLFAGAVYGIMSTVLSPPPPKMKQVVQQISLLPPPPPPVEQAPQPEIKEPVPIPEPAPVSQDDAPPPGNLGLDANGTAGSDAFQLQARKGGRGLLDAGGQFDWFANRIQESIYKVLSANKKIHGANYVVKVNLWLNPDGSVKHFDLIDSTGNPTLDRSIKLALAEVGSLVNELPPDLPQPVRLKIVSRQ